MKENKLIPKRRFKEFINDEAWKQRKLGEVVKLNGRIGFRGYTEKDIITKDEGGVLTFSPTNIVKNRLTTDCRNTYITRFKYNESPEIQIKNGDVLFVKTGSTLGKSALVKGISEDATVNPQVVVIRVEKDTEEYFSALLTTENILKQVEKRKIGGAVPTLTEAQINDLNIIDCQSKSEKHMIGTFFSKLDNLISLHHCKLKKLKEIKLAYLSEMFPKKGEKYPKLRFAGFTDPWEKRKFGDIAVRISSISTVAELPRVEYEDIISGQGVLNKDIYEKQSNKQGIQFQSNDVLYGKLRPYLKNWLFARFSGIAVGDFWVLRGNDTDGLFLYTLIQSKEFDKVANQSTGTKMPRADWSLVSNTEFYIPSQQAEQRRIGEYLHQLDKLINLHQRKLEKLENIKKAYLNEMFM